MSSSLWMCFKAWLWTRENIYSPSLEMTSSLSPTVSSLENWLNFRSPNLLTWTFPDMDFKKLGYEKKN